MIWKTIKDFPEYAISNEGQIKSIQRVVKSTAGWHNSQKGRTVSERILKPALTQNGYYFVTLRRNGRHHPVRIHQIVAHEFIGSKLDGLVINHKNGIKTDNKVENLEYCSKAKNTQEYYISIGKRKGKVPYFDIPIIINRINMGEEVQSIAKEYKVTRNDIAVLGKIIALTGEELEFKEPVNQ